MVLQSHRNWTKIGHFLTRQETSLSSWGSLWAVATPSQSILWSHGLTTPWHRDTRHPGPSSTCLTGSTPNAPCSRQARLTTTAQVLHHTLRPLQGELLWILVRSHSSFLKSQSHHHRIFQHYLRRNIFLSKISQVNSKLTTRANLHRALVVSIFKIRFKNTWSLIFIELCYSKFHKSNKIIY